MYIYITRKCILTIQIGLFPRDLFNNSKFSLISFTFPSLDPRMLNSLIFPIFYDSGKPAIRTKHSSNTD